MANPDSLRAVSDYWNRDGLGQTILEALVASGKRLDALTIEDLAPVDQFHSGGIEATTALAELADLSEGARVLDVGGGLGGPTRTLAVQFGCEVTTIDLAETYVQTAEILTERIGLGDQVKHHAGDALELPFDDGAFDVVWTQQSGMNVRDKERLYEGFHRVLTSRGTLAFQELMAGPVQPLIYPVMWAHDAGTSFLRTQDEMRKLIEAAGFRTRAWNEMTADASTPGPPGPQHGIVEILMGDDLPAIQLAGKRNVEEGRMVWVRAVFERI